MDPGARPWALGGEWEVNSTKSQENVAEVLLNERGIVGITCKFH